MFGASLLRYCYGYGSWFLVRIKLYFFCFQLVLFCMVICFTNGKINYNKDSVELQPENLKDIAVDFLLVNPLTPKSD